MPDTTKKQRRHILTNGHRCAAVCLRNEDFCYYHHSTRRRKDVLSQNNNFELLLPEDRSAIQTAIGLVLQPIASNNLDPGRAGLLLYGLQIASLNLPKENPDPNRIPESPVDEVVFHPELGPIAPLAEIPLLESVSREQQLDQRERDLAARNVRLGFRQDALDRREHEILERTNQLDKREKELKEREGRLREENNKPNPSQTVPPSFLRSMPSLLTLRREHGPSGP